jgi:hypothetical protein
MSEILTEHLPNSRQMHQRDSIPFCLILFDDSAEK